MKRIQINEEKCIGCRACESVCSFIHSIKDEDYLDSLKTGTTRPLPRRKVEEKLQLNDHRVRSISLGCQHCDEPSCVYACLTGALNKDPISGIVTHDDRKCIGCWTCMLVCPYAALRQDTLKGKAIKCDLCHGQEDEAACALRCPTGAIIYSETEKGQLDLEIHAGSQK